MAGPRRAPLRDGPGPSRQREALLVLLVAAVVVLAALAGPLAPRYHDAPGWLTARPGDALATIAVSPPAPPPAAEPPANLSLAWLGEASKWVGIALLVATVAFTVRLVVLWLLERWREIDRGGGSAPAGGAVAEDELDAAARAALGEGVADAGRALRDELPPGDAVVAAWLALERAAGACGVERDPAQTASEFTVALLDRTPADPRAARTLLRLYHAARFSGHAVGAADVVAARGALDVLAAALASSGAAPDSSPAAPTASSSSSPAAAPTASSPGAPPDGPGAVAT